MFRSFRNGVEHKEPSENQDVSTPDAEVDPAMRTGAGVTEEDEPE